MVSRRERITGRRERGSFLLLPHAYLDSEQYAQLSPRAVKALLDLASQYRGKNNGDLAATWSVMRRCGWTSKDQLYKALQELLNFGWIVCTRRGGRDRTLPTLYAVTIWGIDYCGGKLDAGITIDRRPLLLWKESQRPTIRPSSKRQVVKRLARVADCIGPSCRPNIVPFRADQPVQRVENTA
jgi:hypothetical protein